MNRSIYVQWVRATVVAGPLLLLATLPSLAAEPASKSTAACILLTKEGKVEVASKGGAWSVAQTNQALNFGDRLRTGLRSRATLRWSDLSVVRVDELTSMEIQPPDPKKSKPQLELKSGATYFFSREKADELQFRTPIASGAIRGTEFNLAVADDGRTVLSLLDGEVDLVNAQGKETFQSGQQGTVEQGQPPKKAPLLNAINVIQWVLYYPAVVDPDELGLSAQEKETFTDALKAYRSGDLLAGVAALPENRQPTTDAERAFQASLLLAAGRVAQAETALKAMPALSPPANALREVMAAVKHETLPTLSSPTTASEWMARSYYQQSQSKLPEALAAAREATTKSPGFGAAWVRRAELEFGFGRTSEALTALNRGLELSPRNAQGLALKGYILAARGQWSDARSQFDQAIEADGALANAWLGRGLVKIHAGQDSAGRDDLQVAATLEPQRAVLRSYLGKAWSQTRDGKRAEKELRLARQLDPNDPTGWFYSALLEQQENRINEAVTSLERSKELNENRSVFRSRELLDKDLSVRSANLAAMYRDAGMFDRSVQEAARAVNSDYANYSAHLFLADSYNALRDPKLINLRYETPWFSELLVANLLGPAAGGTLSPNVSDQEYTRFFEREHFGLFSSTEYASSGDWLQRGSQYGIFGNSSYSLDAYYRTENGQRHNNDLEQLNLTLRFKHQVTEKDGLFLEVGYFKSESGDVAQYYDQDSASRTFRATETQEPTLLLGYHREWAPDSHTLFLFTRFDDTLELEDSDSRPLARTTYTVDLGGGAFQTNDFLSNLRNAGLDYRSELEAYSGELQHFWQLPEHTLIVGGKYQAGWSETSTELDRAPTGAPGSVGISLPQQVDTDLDRLSFYAYDHWHPFETLRLTAGVSYDRLHYPVNIDTSPITDKENTKDQVSPKAGLVFTPARDTQLRAMYSQSLGGVFFDQSVRLEPTQVGGFNQAFRSAIPESVAGLVPGTRFETWGVGLDQAFRPTRSFLTVEGQFLNSDASRTVGLLTNDAAGAAPLTPNLPSSARQTLDYREQALIVAFNQLVGTDWGFGARYKMTHADLDQDVTSIPSTTLGTAGFNQDVSATLHQIDLYAIYNHRCGFFARFDAIWSQQSNVGYTPDIPGDDFWQYNVYFGYRFWQRRMEARIGLWNLSDRDYKLNPLTLYSELPRERTLTVGFKFYF